MDRPLVFISYSWDSVEHREWVLKLSNDLISRYGINVLLDQYELSAGKDLTYYMESSIEQSTKVLLILTPNYKLKAENRTGGVGYEYSMISQELFDIQANNNKFIPILRSGDLNSSSPKYIKSKIFHTMVDNSVYLNQLYELTRIIYEKPKLIKPALGAIPDFENIDFDPIIELANEISNKERLNKELNQIINSKEGINLVNVEIDNLHKSIKEKAELYSSNSPFRFNVQVEYRKNIILSYGGYSVLINWNQVYNNSLEDSKLTVSFWKGHIALNSYNSMYFPGKEPKRNRTVEYKFDLNLKKENIWRLKDKTEITTDKIIKESFSYILIEIQNEKMKDFREE